MQFLFKCTVICQLRAPSTLASCHLSVISQVFSQREILSTAPEVRAARKGCTKSFTDLLNSMVIGIGWSCIYS